MLDTLSALLKTREILADASHWTQGAYAMTGPAHEGPIDAGDPRVTSDLDAATCFCLHGAFCKASEQELRRYGHWQLNSLLSECLPESFRAEEGDDLSDVVAFNDEPDRTHEEVLAVLDCAIAKEQAKAESAA